MLAASALVHADRNVELDGSAPPTSELPTPEPVPVVAPDHDSPVFSSTGRDASTIGIRPLPVLPAASVVGTGELDDGAPASSSASSLVAATRSATLRNATLSVESAITTRT